MRRELTKSELKHFKPLASLGPISLDKAVGKRVATIVREYPGLLIVFDDGSFMVIQIGICEECSEHADWHVCAKLTDDMPRALLRAGVASPEQFDGWSKEQESKRIATRENDERKQYERLKAKFGTVPSPTPESDA